jgi:hypothetical protein
MINRRQFMGTGLAAACTLSLPGRAIAHGGTPDDIALLRELLTTLHPGLYRYASPSGLDAGLERLQLHWRRQPDLASRYLNLSRFLATIKCGHSYANFFNQKKAVAASLFEGRTRVPFAFKWVGTQMVVLADQSGSGSLPRGTIVKAINDVPTANILSRLLPYARADGSNDAKRRALLSVTGKDDIESFDVFYGLVFGEPGSARNEPAQGVHRLRVRLPGTANDVWVDLPAPTLAERLSFQRKVDYRGDQPVWDWSMREDGIAHLTMDSWGLYNSKWDWRTWLDDRLDSLRGAKGLIIDIRENEGGNDCGDAILQRFADRDIALPAANHLVRYRKVPDALNPYLDTWDDNFRDWGEKVVPFNDRFLRRVGSGDAGVLPARGPRIDLPLMVLTSAQNSSATFQFANLCRQTGIGTLIGETTGGNRRGINGGAFFFARLPESGIEFDLPLIGYYPEAKMPDAGIEPDIAVAPTANDIASGRDPVLDRAIRHLNRL